MRKAENVFVTEMGDDLALFSEETGEYFVLNEVGKDIWTIMDQTLEVSGIVDELIKMYDITSDQCTEQVETFIKTLFNEKLLLA